MSVTTGSVRVVFWNTWLLRPRLWSGGPALPFTDRLFAPDVTRRAPLVGRALAGRFDVCALAEVFDEREQDTVALQWDEVEYQPGPGASSLLKRAGSGLMTLVDPMALEVTATATHTFTSGGDLRDSDSYASMGALFTRVRLPGGAELDVVSTHLLAGGEMLPIPGSSDHARHHRARMAQVDELVDFVQHERDQENPLLVVGDFNVAAHDRRIPRHPDAYYRDLVDHLAPLDVVDLWATDGIGQGPTAGFAPGDAIAADPALPDCVLDQPDDTPEPGGPGRPPGDRIDYLWYSPPWRRARTTAQLDRPRRWSFPGRPARGGPAGGLSDHLALSVTIHLHRR
ncbi:MAG TPA: endonuclease/exonuclease/phosphatase family protein [Acidimicrobiales bacterium]|nr:endonuclease/exonuclease/phosphatase family protein [Acidimicrobiales bacterium]